MIDRTVLKNLSESDPRIRSTRDGNFTLTVNGRQFHSVYSPVQEAARLAGSDHDPDRDRTVLVFLGAGLGYTVEEMEKRGYRNAVVLETDPAAHEIFRKVYNLPPGYTLLGPGNSPEDLDNLFSSVDIASVRRFRTVILRGAYAAEQYAGYEERMERLMKVKLGDFATRMNFEELWTVNILNNMAGLERSSPVRALFGSARGIPVLIVSAGPSLNATLPDIRRAAPHCVTVATDTAFLPLAESGIVPDFVYSLDSQIHNLSDFALIPRAILARTRLVHDVVTHPSLPRIFHRAGASVYAANTAHLDTDSRGKPVLVKSGLVSYLESQGGFSLGDVETGGSVSTSAFHFAWLLGGHPVILAGQDLSYTNRTTHAPSTSHYYRAIRRANRLNTLPSVFQNVILSRRTLTVPDLTGTGEVTTDFVLNNYRQWLEESVRSAAPGAADGGSGRFLNATAYGARISGFQGIALNEWADQRRDHPAVQKRFPIHLINSSAVGKIKNALRNLPAALRNMSAERETWNAAGRSQWPFLERYFLREKTFFERYGRLDTAAVDRKIRRLEKNLNRLVHGL